LAGKSRSLRLELVASLTMVLVMAVISLSLAAELLGQRRHDLQELARLRDHTRSVAVLAAREFRGPTEFDRDKLGQLLHQSAASQLGVVALRVYAVGSDGATQLEAVGLSEDYPPPQSGAARLDDGRLDDIGLVIIDEPIPTFGGVAGGRVPLLRVVAEPSPWTSSHDWRETLIVASGVGIVLLLLGFGLVELQVIRPLRAVEQAVGEVEAGNLSARVPEEGATEFRELASAFNRMTRALEHQREQLAQQRDQLQRSQQLAAFGSLAAGVAHEVGNPLAATLGYVEFLLDPRSQLDAEQRGLLERVHSQTQRIQAIVGQLLEYSRPSHSRVQPVALRGAVEETLHLLEQDPRAAGVCMQVDGHEDTKALADPGLLHQVLLNLVVNACHAARDHAAPAPRVRVRVGRVADEPRAFVEVQDNGPGVSDDVRPRLFEPFFTTRAAGEGTGLGLAISQGLVESMHGSLECLPSRARSPLDDAEQPNEAANGAVFRVTLPVPEDHELSGEREPERPAAAHS
jgi:two-component system, NtrC family, sensor kinase